MLVVVLLLPLSLAKDDGEFNNSGGGVSGGSPAAMAAVAVAAVAAVDNRGGVQWRWCLGHSIVVAAWQHSTVVID
jgi:hypothetical protein